MCKQLQNTGEGFATNRQQQSWAPESILPTKTAPSNLCYSPLQLSGCRRQYHMQENLVLEFIGILLYPTSCYIPVNVIVLHNPTRQGHHSKHHFPSWLSRASDMEWKWKLHLHQQRHVRHPYTTGKSISTVHTPFTSMLAISQKTICATQSSKGLFSTFISVAHRTCHFVTDVKYTGALLLRFINQCFFFMIINLMHYSTGQ